MSNVADSRVRYIRNPENLGMVGNFRRVLELTTGKYICFLSSDDLLKPGFISWAVAMLEEKYPQAAFAYCGVEFFDKRTGQQVWEFPECMAGRAFVLESFARGQNLSFLCGALARRDLVAEVGIEDLTFFDWTLWLRLALRGDVVYTPRVLAAYRVHSANETVKTMHRPSQHLHALSESIRVFLQREQPDSEIRRSAGRCLGLLYTRYVLELARKFEQLSWSEYLKDWAACMRTPAPLSAKISASLKSVMIRVYRKSGIRALVWRLRGIQ
jgi:glycosyltransferase involved in cell wall biosynthesis